MKNLLFLGLGNIESQYQYTIHNVGSLVIQAYIGENYSYLTKISPQLFMKKDMATSGKSYYAYNISSMNVSGTETGKLIRKYNINHFIVFVDDIRKKIGTYKLEKFNSHLGHNGIKDIVSNCGKEFYLLRIGVGPVPSKWELSDYVLSKIPEEVLQKIMFDRDRMWKDIDNLLLL
jgi:PTH1 family peptidyl-tRNA hydrolase